MSSRHTYKTIAHKAEAVYTDKGSRFIGLAISIHSEEDVKEALKRIKGEYKGARHYCYAFILGTDGQLQRSNDDGEPGGTAGKPILNQILSKELTQCLVVVVRYFGGVLLGTSGLIQAYKTAAREALEAAGSTEHEIMRRLHIQAGYTALPQIMTLMKRYQLRCQPEDAGGNGLVIDLPVPLRIYEQLYGQLKAITGLQLE